MKDNRVLYLNALVVTRCHQKARKAQLEMSRRLYIQCDLVAVLPSVQGFDVLCRRCPLRLLCNLVVDII